MVQRRHVESYRGMKIVTRNGGDAVGPGPVGADQALRGLAGVPAGDVERGSTTARATLARRRGGRRTGGSHLCIPAPEPDRL